MIYMNASPLDGSLIFTISFFMTAASFIGYLIYAFSGNKWAARTSFSILTGIFILQTVAFIIRWRYTYSIGIHTPPLTDLYDSLVFFAYIIIFGFILLRVFYNFDAMGFIITAIAGAALAFASFSPIAPSLVEPTIPALRSYWLLYHIVTLFIAYGAFAASFGLGILFLLKFRKENKPSKNSKKETGFLSLIPHSSIIDEVIYKVIVFGFLFLTAGVIIGAAWANNAWGGYWSWDPKETFSLITWLTYALFIHARITKGWSAKRMAWIAVAGFIVVIFCYLGVDLVIPGLHSYATPAL